jgi:3-oxoacyl-[acyl-carrier-protein] synthase II
MPASPRPQRRTLITGLGPITAFGVGIDSLWRALCEGRSAIRRITRLDPSGFPCQVAGEIADDLFDVKSVVPKSYRKATKVMARDIELAVGAAAAAISDAGLVTKAVNAEATPTIPAARFGCHIGAGLIAADADELTAALVTSRDAASGEFDLKHWGATGMQNLTPLWLLKYLPNMLACHVTIIHDCEGPSNTITCAEASAMLSIGESQRAIQRGAADACLSGGAECKLNTMGYLRQWFAKRLAPAGDGVDGASVVKPFDREANGSVLGEGGGLIVLEAEDSASARAAPKVYCELAGFAASQSFSSDATGMEIDEQGESISDAIEMALAAAKMRPDEIDCIAPFGSGIAAVDRIEAAAIRKVFGERASQIPLITTIPNVGNTTAGSGAVSVAAVAMALKTQTLPARINTTNAIDGLMANASPSQPTTLRSVLVLSTGMGGQNAAIVLRAV